MATALGVRLATPGGPPRLEQFDVHPPRGREVLVNVAAAGLCQSDLHVIDEPPDFLRPGLPFTLGHEVAGTVAAVGDQVEAVRVGDRVAVYGPWGCGECARCREGSENYCANRRDLGFSGIGLGRDGGMADRVLVNDERQLLLLDGLDPVQAAPLTDAGLTSLHAVNLIAARLPTAPVVVVIGVGGLGHLAVQLLRATTPALVVAVDAREEALHLAGRCGAQRIVDAGTGPAGIMAATGGQGADAVLDMVGAATSLDAGMSVLRPGGDLVVVGSGGGRVVLEKGSVPQGVRVALPYWGSRQELQQVLALARAGTIRAEVETFPLADAGEAIRRLRSGGILGRAVLIPA